MVAHGVFVYLPFLVTCGYLAEALRVAADGGYIAFDVLTENCLDSETVQRWLASGEYYPCFFGKQYTIDFMARAGCVLVSSFFNRKYGPGRSEYLVFRK